MPKDSYIKRSSGILMPVFSLPSPYGIGTLGQSAREFLDFLSDASQAWWQILPVGPTSYGDSPYQSLSTYAGNPYLIDLDILKEDGLITEQEMADIYWGDNSERVDYGALYQGRFLLLKKATERGFRRDRQQVADFEAENSDWLPDYALFMALKRHFGMRPWTDWPDEDVRLRKPETIKKYREELKEDIKNKFIDSRKDEVDENYKLYLYEYKKPNYHISCDEFYEYIKTQKRII